jgi:hypothetical protein
MRELQGWAAKLLLLLIDKFIFNGIRELTSFGCGLAFPYFSLLKSAIMLLLCRFFGLRTTATCKNSSRETCTKVN